MRRLWKGRIRGERLPEEVGKQSSGTDAESPGTPAYSRSFPFKDLNVQESTVSLWARNISDVAISDSTIIASSGDVVYSWGGQSLWWHEVQADSELQNKPQGPLTARSTIMQGRPAVQGGNGIAGSIRPVSLSNEYGEQYTRIKKVLQYYGFWKVPEKGVDFQDYANRGLQNLVTRERLELSLQIRGRFCSEMTKMEMLNILYSEISLEYELLGEVVHLSLRDLEKEIIDFRSRRKLKLAKRR